MKEFPTTNPNLALDNRSDGPVDGGGSNGGDAVDGGVPLPPKPPSPAPANGGVGDLDDLF